MKQRDSLFSRGDQMKIGYARVSTEDQNLDSQIDALKKEGCDDIFSEKVSGASSEREALKKVLTMLREGDTLVVYKLDRLGRTVKQLVSLIEQFQEKGIQFKSIKDTIDTATPNGRFFFHIMSAFSELERELIRERTQPGLSAARARGKQGGRPTLHNQDKKEIAYQMVMEKPHKTVSEIAKALHMSRSTIYRHIDKRRALG